TPVSFQLAVTNLATLNLTNVFVTVVVDGPVQFLSATNRFGSVTNFTNLIFFTVNALTNKSVATLGYTLNPVSFGRIDHSVLVEATNAAAWETNFLTRIIAGRANLGVTFRGIPSGALAGDLLAYQTPVTNGGPNAAIAVQLTHTLPSGLTLLGVDPPGQTFSEISNVVTVPLGLMTNGASTVVQFRVKPTLAGTLPLTASIAAPGFDNPGTNSQATASLKIATPGPGRLAAFVKGPQVFNRQNGLMEQPAMVTNVGPTSITAARVMIAGVTNWVYNAAGTNQTTPFVVVEGLLPTGGSAQLLLQYFNPARQPTADPDLSGLDVPIPGPTRPVGTVVPLSAAQPGPDGFVTLEFPTI
ncbi:MAG TPA: hypothetical protein DCE44_06220, partial [Verrucomicrobiales bacterium]|nr:hypothetical protein [Verrucomicrobiales bacterium]